MILPRRVQSVEERPVEPVVEEIFLGGRCRVEEGAQVFLVALEGQPALALDEVEEHQAVEKPLHVEATRLALGYALDAAFHFLKNSVVFGEEAFGDSFNIKGRRPLPDPGVGVAVVGEAQRR